MEVKIREIEGKFAFEIESAHPSSRCVGSGKEDVSRVIRAIFAEEEDVLEVRVEPFGGEVHFPRTKLAIPIGTEGRAMRILGSEIRIEGNERHYSTHCRHVEIFVVRLWGTITTAISGTNDESVNRRVTQGSTGIEDDRAEHIVLLETTTKEDGPLFVLPFVLRVRADHMHFLTDIAVIA